MLGLVGIPKFHVLACEVRTVSTALPVPASSTADALHGSGEIDGDVVEHGATATPLRKTTSCDGDVEPNTDLSSRNVSERGLAVVAAGASICTPCPTNV